MAFKKKLDVNADTAIALGGKNGQGKANPTEIEGHYLGAKSVETDYGPAKLHVFATESGNVGVWGKTNLNRILTNEQLGQMCRVTFTGMGKAQKGRRPPYNYELQYDDENTIDVSGINLSAEGSQEPDYDTSSSQSTQGYDDESDSVDPEDDEKPVDELPPRRATPPRAAAVAPNAAAVARTQSLLNGRNKVS